MTEYYPYSKPFRQKITDEILGARFSTVGWDDVTVLFRCVLASLYEGVSVRPYVRPLTLRKNRRDASYCPPGLVSLVFAFLNGFFLDAPLHLYKKVCLSVRPRVR